MAYFRKIFALCFWAGLANSSQDSGQDLRSCLEEALQRDGARVRFSSDPEYAVRNLNPFNLNLQYNASAVVYPNSTEEIVDIVSCAGKYGRKVQARGGGRDFINRCLGGADDAIVVDMANFDKREIDKETGVAVFGSGLLLKDVARFLHQNGGRYFPHGASPTVGIGGHIMVGGMGYSSRKNGLSIDAVREIEVVLADGTVAQASISKNPDLFWAMRGAGASFGIATQYTFQTMPEPETVLSYVFNFTSNDPANLKKAVKAYHKIVQDPNLSRNMGGTTRLSRNSFLFDGAFFGTEEEFNAMRLESRLPITTSTTITANLSWIDYSEEVFGHAGKTNSPAYFYTQDMGVSRHNVPSDASVDAWLDYIFSADSDSATWSFQFDLTGGKTNEVASDATAFPHRDSIYFMTAYASSNGETSDKTIKFINEDVLKLQGNKPDEYMSYVGVASLAHGKNAQKRYWGTNLPRLEKIKAQVDPDDIFSTPQYVKPANS
ncbi:hypothetical protein ACHAPJ_010263 [Fusarium lateritium]